MRDTEVKFGIGGRLFLAFGTVAGMTVVASLFAWISFSGLSDSLDRIISDDIPAMTAATDLAEKGGLITATAPTLISAPTEADRAKAWAGLQAPLKDMMSSIDGLDERIIAPEVRSSLRRLMERIAENLGKLDANVRRRFQLALRKEELTERLRWVHADFLDEIEPMVDDARFNIETAVERVEEGELPLDSLRGLSILPDETRKQEAVLEVNAGGNLAVGLIGRAANMPNEEGLNDLRLFLGEVSDQLVKDLAILSGDPASVSLRQATDDILSYARGETDLFSLRRRELATFEDGLRLLTVNRELVETLENVIADQVKAVNSATADAAARSGRAIERGKILLFFVAVASLLVAVLVVWLYVGRNLVRRIKSLGGSMREIAAGDLKADVVTGGSDEISEMAEALRVFRDTAADTQAELIQAGKLAALGQLSAGISHELNQPLAAIRSYAHNAGVLTERERLDEARENLAKISELTERMAGITNHLKTFARRPSKKIGRIDLNKAVENALDLLDRRIRDEEVSVSLDFPGTGLFVKGGEIRLEQVFVNLIGNALDAMREVSTKELRIRADLEEDMTAIAIQDTGTGLSDEELALIFDPFYTSKEVGKGLGLGLSISYNIVRDFGGSIKATSNPGEGTTFTIRLEGA